MTEARPIARSRIAAIDALRGIVMIVMALDHTRDFVHNAAGVFSPTDLTKTSVVLFFTRWITHFCLPVFMFTAGVGVFLWMQSGGRSKRELSRFLVTRGLWFMLLELTVMRLSYDFNFSLQPIFFLLVLWIFGLCMILLAAFIHLPARWLAALSIAVIALHNMLDGIKAQQFGGYAWVWNFIHQPGLLTVDGHLFFIVYPLIAWSAVMAAGFCFGRVLLWDPEARRRFMLRCGAGLIVGFLVMRGINIYGDPVRWSVQKSAAFTVMSFLNCTKNPPSLDFLLMTLGPALVLLSFLDRCTFRVNHPFMVFGRVPLFYFVVHFYLIHIVAAMLALLRYGRAAWAFIFQPVPSMSGPRELFPAHYGYDLWAVYVAWIFIVASLYPLCLWFGRVKASRRSWWLSYL